MTDDTWDETSIASGFVVWYTEPRAYGSYTPLIEEEATRIFFDWLRKVKAAAWSEGQQAGWCEGYSHGEPENNPYRN